MIGAAAALLLLFSGRIAGVSGIVGQLFLSRMSRQNLWRLLFVLGILSGAALYRLTPAGVSIQMQAEGWWLITAGLLVGIGTRLGSGCTSGHGVCGIARLSPRSIVATVTFIATAVATVYVIRQLT